MARLLDFIKELLLPARCTVCGAEPEEKDGRLLCRVCRNRYENERHSRCGVCHRFYDECDCRPQFASPYIGRYLAVTYYQEGRVSGKLLLAAKDHANKKLNVFLAKQMASVLRAHGICPEVVTYVPCSSESYRKRGFDHGKQLAKALSAELGVPMENCLLKKRGKEQKMLDAAKRLANSKSSIRARKGAAEKIKGKRVLLVDDIMTTGASSLVASVHLDEMGAEDIDFVCFGRR